VKIETDTGDKLSFARARETNKPDADTTYLVDTASIRLAPDSFSDFVSSLRRPRQNRLIAVKATILNIPAMIR